MGKDVDWSTYRRLRNTVTRLTRQSKENHTRTNLKESSDNPTYFWDQIKKVYPVKNSKVNLPKTFTVNGDQCSDKKIIVNGFCEYFTNIGKNLQSRLISLVDPVWRHFDSCELRKKVNLTQCYFEVGI